MQLEYFLQIMKLFRSSNRKPEATNQLTKNFSLAKVLKCCCFKLNTKTSVERKTHWQ